MLSAALTNRWRALACRSVSSPSLPQPPQKLNEDRDCNESLKGALPSPPIQQTLLNVKVLDSILDVCRPVHNPHLAPEQLGSPSPLFWNSIPPASRPNLKRYPKGSSDPASGHSVLCLLQNYLQDQHQSPHAHNGIIHSQPSAKSEGDSVMARLVSVQVAQTHFSKKHAIIARLVEFSRVLRSWLMVGSPFPSLIFTRSEVTFVRPNLNLLRTRATPALSL